MDGNIFLKLFALIFNLFSKCFLSYRLDHKACRSHTGRETCTKYPHIKKNCLSLRVPLPTREKSLGYSPPSPRSRLQCCVIFVRKSSRLERKKIAMKEKFHFFYNFYYENTFLHTKFCTFISSKIKEIFSYVVYNPTTPLPEMTVTRKKNKQLVLIWS